MKKKLTAGNHPIIVIIILVILFSVTGYGVFSPALPSAYSESDSLGDHFRIWYYDHDVMGVLPFAFLCSNENGRMADGELMFVPLKSFLEHSYRPPEVFVQDQLYSVWYESGYYDETSVSIIFYQPTNDGFDPILKESGEPVEMSDLRPGDYLMQIGVTVVKGETYYSGAGFLHLIIPGDAQSVWPISDSVLTSAPSPELAPTPSPCP